MKYGGIGKRRLVRWRNPRNLACIHIGALSARMLLHIEGDKGGRDRYAIAVAAAADPAAGLLEAGPGVNAVCGSGASLAMRPVSIARQGHRLDSSERCFGLRA
jgi:hypothetical protein